MRLLEVEIANVRGIRSITLGPNGKNLVVWGPNGSGKSALVDALDFVLTGQVSRLTGKGSGGLSLPKHGPHIDCAASDASVRAVFQLEGGTTQVEITRRMNRPEELLCDTQTRAALQPVLDMAARGQHVLTRREILRFIASEGASRATEIQALLDLSEVEEVRKSLVNVDNDAVRTKRTADAALAKAQTATGVTLDQRRFDAAAVLAAANAHRAVLGGEPVSELRASELKASLMLPRTTSGEQTLNVTVLETDFAHLLAVLAEDEQELTAATDATLREAAGALAADPAALKALSRMELIELGLPLIDETGACPLCERPWAPGVLADELQQKLQVAQAASPVSAKVKVLVSALATKLDAATECLSKLIAAVQAAGLVERLPTLVRWAEDVHQLSECLAHTPLSYAASACAPDAARRLAAPADAEQVLQRTRDELRAAYPAATPEQTAWDTLTRLGVNLTAVERARGDAAVAAKVSERSAALLKAFLCARSEVLDGLYAEIADRFAELYRGLHGADEATFTAEIHPEGAALEIGVDFYGRGVHPPHALHSEGHQDSMGICLYLALAERLTRGLIGMTILDDVVMSVDADHRRDLCTMLRRYFADRQFIITTHDRDWARQLRREGLVSRDNSIEFYNWSLATGPQWTLERDMWERIDELLEHQNVPEAAARLRRGSEEWFAHVCDALGAEVAYHLDGRYDLGEYLPAAISRYRDLMKKAKAAARSWDRQQELESLLQLEAVASSIFERSNAERWAVNSAVHFNNWSSLTPGEFRPVVSSFLDLQGLFACRHCGSFIRVAKDGYELVVAKCSCGLVRWDFVPRAGA